MLDELRHGPREELAAPPDAAGRLAVALRRSAIQLEGRVDGDRVELRLAGPVRGPRWRGPAFSGRLEPGPAGPRLVGRYRSPAAARLNLALSWLFPLFAVVTSSLGTAPWQSRPDSPAWIAVAVPGLLMSLAAVTTVIVLRRWRADVRFLRGWLREHLGG